MVDFAILYMCIKVHSHLALGILVLSSLTTMLVIYDLNLLTMKILC